MIKQIILATDTGLKADDLRRHNWHKFSPDQLKKIRSCFAQAKTVIESWQKKIKGYPESIDAIKKELASRKGKSSKKPTKKELNAKLSGFKSAIQSLCGKTEGWGSHIFSKKQHSGLSEANQKNATNACKQAQQQLAKCLSQLKSDTSKLNKEIADATPARRRKTPKRTVLHSTTTPKDPKKISNPKSVLYTLMIAQEKMPKELNIPHNTVVAILQTHIGRPAFKQVDSILQSAPGKLKACAWIFACKQAWNRRRSVSYHAQIPLFLKSVKPDVTSQQEVDDFVTYSAFAGSVRPEDFSQEEYKAICCNVSAKALPLAMQGVLTWIEGDFLSIWIGSVADDIEKDPNSKSEKLEKLYRLVSYRGNSTDVTFAKKWVLQAETQHVPLIAPHLNRWIEATQSKKLKQARVQLVDHLFSKDETTVRKYLNELVPWDEKSKYSDPICFGELTAFDYSIYAKQETDLMTRIRAHAIRRCKLFLGTLLYAYGTKREYRYHTPCRPQKSTPEKKILTKGLHGCHSSILPSIQYREEGYWNLSRYNYHHFSQLTNSTVELPDWVNAIDSEIEGDTEVLQLPIYKPKTFGHSRYDVLLSDPKWGESLDGKQKLGRNSTEPRLRAFSSRIVNWVSSEEQSVEEGFLQFLIAKYMIVKHLLRKKDTHDDEMPDLEKLKISEITWRGDSYTATPSKESKISREEVLIAQAEAIEGFVEFSHDDKPVRLKANVVWDHLKGVFQAFQEHQSLVNEVEGRGGWVFVQDRAPYYKKYQEIMYWCKGGKCAIAKQMGMGDYTNPKK